MDGAIAAYGHAPPPANHSAVSELRWICETILAGTAK